jgi:hypothetical protein
MAQMACTVFTVSPFTFTGKATKALYFLMMLCVNESEKEEVSERSTATRINNQHQSTTLTQ